MSRKKIEQIIVKCDICGNETECEEVLYPVLFTSDQTEGRPCKPYISKEKIDLCNECAKKVIKITGYGAQGYNTYKILG